MLRALPLFLWFIPGGKHTYFRLWGQAVPRLGDSRGAWPSAHARKGLLRVCGLTVGALPSCFLLMYHSHAPGYFGLLDVGFGVKAVRTWLLCSCREVVGRAKAQGCCSLVEWAEDPSVASRGLHVLALLVSANEDFREATAVVREGPLQ